MSLLLAVIVIRVREPPPHPGMVRLALLPLGAVLDDPAARAQELDRLRNDADLELAVYSADKRLVASSIVPAPPLPDDLPRPFERGGFDGFDRKVPPSSSTPGPDAGVAASPPQFGGPDGVEVRRDRSASREPSRIDRDEFKRRNGPKKKLDFWFFALQWSTSSHVHRLSSTSGVDYWVVQVRPGEWPIVVAGGIGVVALLGLLSLLFAATLARPLRELGRATSSFGQGDVNTRVDLDKAGPFADLARTFNDMADRVTSARRAERELLANVGHELRTPLARIRVALDIADEGDAHLARESLAEIGSDLGELETIIEDILTATRLE
ncbi:MAG TPA: histidine kinase dimerization/phospho-acceptor domain-containing protein, partial [Myxococcota bacterium]